jgi:quercetin dioxygenase-like cupin family protein
MVAPEIVTMGRYRDDRNAGIGAPDAAGAAAHFTGKVWQDEVVVGQSPSRMRATVVSFTRGARAGWHAHPVGQVLYCLSGVGRICIGRAAQPQAIYPGDTVMIPPDTMHWHGAAPDRLFSHLAMSESGKGGQGTDWAEYVSDENYNKPAAP